MPDDSPSAKSENIITLELVDSPQGQRVASSFLLADLRNSPRFDTCTPAELITVDGSLFPCNVTNISSTGLQFEGDWGERSTRRTGFLNFRKHKASIVEISFSLPDKVTHHNPVVIVCKTVYVRSAKQDIILTGARFISFKTGEDILTEYLLFRELIS